VSARAFIALGANLGDRAASLARARAAISLLPCRLAGASRIEETIPFGPSAQAPYLNQMLALDCTMPPLQLLDALLRIEHRLGRVRRERWGPRIIDIDIVRYGDVTMRSPTLTLPHPGLPHRDFWLRELAELETVSLPPERAA
jgi:2-amino-4-hydroxy-6-hydroxymethyldihydropteridine diphosphokinase